MDATVLQLTRDYIASTDFAKRPLSLTMLHAIILLYSTAVEARMHLSGGC